MPCGKRANIEVPSIRHAEHISLSEKKKKWEGTHPGTHKRHCRKCRLTVLASASGELFIAKS